MKYKNLLEQYLEEIYLLFLKDNIREYKSYRIEFEFQSPIALSQPYIHLDGIFLRAYLIWLLGERFYDFYLIRSTFEELFLSVGKDLKKDGYKYPIEFWNNTDVFSASAILFDKNARKHIEVLRKKFEDRYIEKGKIRVGMGKFRNFEEKFFYLNAMKGEGYIRIDAKVMDGILEKGILYAIGDDTRLGWGMLKSIKVEEIKKKDIVLLDGMITRCVPVKYLSKRDIKKINYAYKPPYWNIENVDVCSVPFERYIV